MARGKSIVLIGAGRMGVVAMAGHEDAPSDFAIDAVAIFVDAI